MSFGILDFAPRSSGAHPHFPLFTCFLTNSTWTFVPHIAFTSSAICEAVFLQCFVLFDDVIFHRLHAATNASPPFFLVSNLAASALSNCTQVDREDNLEVSADRVNKLEAEDINLFLGSNEALRAVLLFIVHFLDSSPVNSADASGGAAVVTNQAGGGGEGRVVGIAFCFADCVALNFLSFRLMLIVRLFFCMSSSLNNTVFMATLQVIPGTTHCTFFF